MSKSKAHEKREPKATEKREHGTKTKKAKR